MYLLKPLRLFNLLNKTQVCLCTGTGGTLKLLETCSYCTNIWKLRNVREKEFNQITSPISLLQAGYSHICVKKPLTVLVSPEQW